MMGRYKLEKLIELWVLYDTKNHDYMEESGFNPCFPWVIAYWRQEFHNYSWVMPDFKKAQAEKLLSLLNGKEEQPEKPEPVNYELGQKIQVNYNGWKDAVYFTASENTNYHWIQLVNCQDPITVTSNNIRLPLKSRIRRGQPVRYQSNNKLGFFAGFIGDDMIAIYFSPASTKSIKDWSLPTKSELEKIGQDGLGWLTEDE
jgi:hypothetical protein